MTRKMVSSQTEISIPGNDCLKKDGLRCTRAGSAGVVDDRRGEQAGQIDHGLGARG